MFGVLVVETAEGRREVLRAFSGQLAGRWEVPGWVPPIFDASRRLALEPRAEARIQALTLQIASFPPEGPPRRLAAMKRLRRFLSRRAMRDIFDTYELVNFAGERRPLRSFFEPGAPSWGAGDCAGPKLLHHAARRGLRALALAEFWWGPPPAGGGRREGELCAPCEAKCQPLLPFWTQAR